MTKAISILLLLVITTSGFSQNEDSEIEISAVDNHRVEYPFPDPVSEAVYYTDNFNSQKRIIKADADGNLKVVFEDDKINANHICISPNGEKMLFTGIVGEDNYDIYEHTFNTGKTKQLTKTPEVEFHPKYASDGKSIIFNKQLDTLDLYEIYELDLKTNELRNVSQDTSFSRTFASFNPKMSKLVYVQWFENMNTEIHISDADGKNATNVSDNILFDGWPSWSADGKKIVFASDRKEKFKFQLYTYDINTKKINQITDDEFSYVQPIFRNDSESIIAVKSYKRGFPNQVVEIKLKG